MKKKKKDRIVYIVDDHFELPKKYLNMSTEEIDKLIQESKERELELEREVLSSKLWIFYKSVPKEPQKRFFGCWLFQSKRNLKS